MASVTAAREARSKSPARWASASSTCTAGRRLRGSLIRAPERSLDGTGNRSRAARSGPRRHHHELPRLGSGSGEVGQVREDQVAAAWLHGFLEFDH
jgi:hypothetical protein